MNRKQYINEERTFRKLLKRGLVLNEDYPDDGVEAPEGLSHDEACQMILQYCKENIDDWDRLEREALTKIDHWRCPLQMASPELYGEMSCRMVDWCDMHDYPDDDLDIEEIFWATPEE